jgi:type II secretory ATPase GspE/PulE/Tfp pilus assembly ATPase PilB-like protein
MLAELGGGDRNIVSIEDPVEYHVPFVRQLEVDERHGLTMTAGLKTLLRMDPNVVFVGEIRDLEAADIAMRSASSGRFVLSTLHTRDVAATITACRDLRIDNRSLAGNLNGIINQRLVRRLCAHCRLATPPDEKVRQAFSDQCLDPPLEVFQPRGCDRCKGTGYFGRVGVFEVALLTPAVKEGLAQGVSEQELRDLLRSTGTPSLIADALDKAGSGVTGVDEALQMSAV